VPRHFDYDPHPHRGEHFSHRSSFPAGGSRTHLEPRHFDSPRFLRHGSRLTRVNSEVQRTIKTSSDRMVKC
jgi:hypothetical protein